MIIPIQDEQHQRRSKEQFFAAVDELQRLNADNDPEDVLRDVTEIVEQIRQERYERRRQSDSSGR